MLSIKYIIIGTGFVYCKSLCFTALKGEEVMVEILVGGLLLAMIVISDLGVYILFKLTRLIGTFINEGKEREKFKKRSEELEKRNEERKKKERERLRKLQLRTQLQFMDLDALENLTGHEFEDYFSQQLSFLGIKNYTTKKSGDFGVDVVVKFDNGYGVQLKHYLQSSVGVSAVQEVYSGASYYDKEPVILTTGYYTKQAVKLARSLDVELIDRTDIKEWHNGDYVRKYNYTNGGLYKDIQKYLITEMEKLQYEDAELSN